MPYATWISTCLSLDSTPTFSFISFPIPTCCFSPWYFICSAFYYQHCVGTELSAGASVYTLAGLSHGANVTDLQQTIERWIHALVSSCNPSQRPRICGGYSSRCVTVLQVLQVPFVWLKLAVAHRIYCWQPVISFCYHVLVVCFTKQTALGCFFLTWNSFQLFFLMDLFLH